MKPEATPIPVSPPSSVSVTQPQQPISQNSNLCREAIKRHWPQHLHDKAFIVLHAENDLETPDRIGAVNKDATGSQDFGCFQINNRWHPNFFATQDWSNADHNAAYAYEIYKSRGNFTAWYAVKGILW